MRWGSRRSRNHRPHVPVVDEMTPTMVYDGMDCDPPGPDKSASLAPFHGRLGGASVSVLVGRFDHFIAPGLFSGRYEQMEPTWYP